MSKVVTPAQTAFEVARQSLGAGLSELEFQYFWAVAERKGLDPLSGEIIPTIRRVWNPETKGYEKRLTIQTGVDGYRHLAERTDEYDGQDEPIFDCEPDGKTPHPNSCKITIYRRIGKGEDMRRVAFTAKVYFHEFAQKNNEGKLISQWGRMPWHMLAKCAEVQAMRKGFPRQVSGLSHDAEMLSDPEAPAPTQLAAKPVAQAVEAIEAPRPAKGLQEDWNKAVVAFTRFDKNPENILAKLGLKTVTEFGREHIKMLQQWYDELELAERQEDEGAKT